MTNSTVFHHSADHAGHPTDSRGRSARLSQSTRHFIRHYVEMVVVMFAGMAFLGLPAGWALGAVGSSWSDLTENAPALMLALMATTMTVPMVAWMRYRGHGRRANAEMAASMVVPTFAAMAMTSVADDTSALLVVEHPVMLLAMLGVMLARPAEYTRHQGQHSRRRAAGARDRLTSARIGSPFPQTTHALPLPSPQLGRPHRCERLRAMRDRARHLAPSRAAARPGQPAAEAGPHPHPPASKGRRAPWPSSPSRSSW